MRMPNHRLSMLVIFALVALLPLQKLRAEPPAHLAKAYFLPRLQTDSDPICKPLLAGARRWFMSSDAEFSPDSATGLSGIDDDPSAGQDNKQTSYTVTDSRGRKSHVIFNTVRGFGGADDQISVNVSDGAGTSEDSVDTPNEDAWTLYRSQDGEHYLLASDAQSIQVYRIAPPSEWRVSCRIATVPADGEIVADKGPVVVAALAAVESVEKLSTGLARGAGDCGSSGAAYYFHEAKAAALERSLYRPWVLRPSSESPVRGSDYSVAIEQLKEWALSGVGEYDAFLNYQTAFAAATPRVSQFFREKFGWSGDKADETARDVVGYAVTEGFHFYQYVPFPVAGEEPLRKAILTHAPMDQIRSIQAEFDKMNHPGLDDDDMFDGDVRADSVLNIAIRYPEALSYLLSKGLDPNSPNGFGKTPLMYTAQYNQLEAAKLLLKAGADPNAHTVIPEDTCNYTIGTHSMTALHYAARYASADFIRLLVSHGAVTYIAASTGTPLDWLRDYTDNIRGHERNPNLPDSDIVAATKMLSPPSDAENVEIARKLVFQAEAASAAKQFDRAHHILSLAVAADPTNQKALADMPLIALKLGRNAEAAALADRATRALRTPQAQAAAWFNEGLACERGGEYVTYDGERYCEDDNFGRFVRSWKLAPSEARENKLKEILGAVSKRAPPSNDMDGCKIAGANGNARVYHLRGIFPYTERVYVLHPKGEQIDPNWINLKFETFPDGSGKASPLRVKETLALSDKEITILESTGSTLLKSALAEGQPCP